MNCLLCVLSPDRTAHHTPALTVADGHALCGWHLVRYLAMVNVLRVDSGGNGYRPGLLDMLAVDQADGRTRDAVEQGMLTPHEVGRGVTLPKRPSDPAPTPPAPH